jgi:type I restriction enzyme M protein
MSGAGNFAQAALPGILDQKLVLQDIRNYLAGQSLGITRDESLLDEVLKCAFCCVQLEARGDITDDSSAENIARSYRTVFKEIIGQFAPLFNGDSEILLGPEQIRFVDRALRPLRLRQAKRDLIGDIYEVFIGSAIRGQDGQFFTPNNAVSLLVRMASPLPEDLIIDPACGAGSFLLQASTSLPQRSAIRQLHGVDKDAYLARLASLRLALKFGKLPEVHCADSLAWSGNGFPKSASAKLKGRYSLVLTNPPFGSRIVAATGDLRKDFDLALKWSWNGSERAWVKTGELQNNASPQVLFVERCLSLLAPNGRLGIVLPESLLSSPSHRYVVQYLLQHAAVLAVIGMPESLFKTSGKGGTHTKVCLLLAQKGKPGPSHRIFMAEAKWCGHDSRGREIERDDFPKVAEKYDMFRGGLRLSEDRLGFLVSASDVRNFILAPRYYDPEPRKRLRALRASHDPISIGQLVRSGHLSIATGDEPGKLAYGGGNVPFVRTSDLSNWEIKIDPKHCVSEDYYRQVAQRQDVREGDILMVRDGTYLIGTCALVTKYDTRICYQSHIYKIRVADSAPLDSYLLLALLSSDPVTSQIKALSFTQDIIDSLGDRIHDVVLPIPKSTEKRQSVSAMVRKVVQERIEARELARRARELVVT